MTSTSAGSMPRRLIRFAGTIGPGRRLSPIVLLLLAGLALRLFIAYVLFPGEGLSSDLRLFRVWAQTLAEHGPGGFYGNAGFADYPPGYLWVLWGIGSLANAIAGLTGAASVDVINALMKLPAIAADIAVAGLLYWSASRWHSARMGLLAAGLYLFVPVTWYDSALWGQVDAIGALLLLSALLLLVAGWSEPAVAVGVLATITKPQYAIGLVVIGAVLLRRHLLARGSGPVPSPRGWGARLDHWSGGWFTTQQGVGRLVSSAFVGAVVAVVAILPFDLPSRASPGLAAIPIIGSIAGLLSVVGSAAGYYAVLTVNAFNAWALVGPNPLAGAISSPDLTWTSDSLQVLGPISAASLGALLLVLVTAIVALTLLVRDDRMAILLGFTVLAVAFFVLPTRVHERYLFPAFGVGALLATISRRWAFWYVVLALTNVANLHAVMTLPFEGYATPGLRGLPLGDFLREPFVVGIIADLHTLLFIGLIGAFLWQVSLPAGRRFVRFMRSESSGRAVAVAPPAATNELSTSRSRDRELATWFQRHRVTPLAASVAPVSPRIEPVVAPEARGRLDRRDLGVFALLVLVVFITRVYRLDMPRTMYFDERWHATSATEFLQDWRYGMPHDLSEVTHPHLAKYFMAAGLVAFGGDHVTSGGLLATPVTDATFEPSYVDGTAPGGLGGNRIIVATGSEVRVAERGDLAATSGFSLPGAISVAADPDAHWTFVGTTGGGVWVVTSADLRAFADLGSVPKARQIATLAGPVVRVWALGSGRVAALTDAGRVSMIDASRGGVLAALNLPGLRAVLPFGPAARHLAALALPDALAVVDTGSMTQIQVIGVGGGAVGLAYVDGGDQQRRERNLLEQPTIYVATGASALATYTMGDDGTLTAAAGVPMPGPVTDIKWDRPTNLVHVLGSAPDGTPTIYVVEPHGNAVFADARPGFQPSAWILDVQPNDPGTDRQRAIAFGSSGIYTTIDVGSHAFAWRLPGVVLGAFTVGLLYLLARLLFRRRSVGLLFAGLLVMDGLLFQQSRIAMNDVYVGFFVVAGFTLLAAFLQSAAIGRRARLEILLIPPLLGMLFGLGLASKWVAAYAIGAAILLILLRSWLGRRIALAAMLGLTGVLGSLAVVDDPANIVFLLLMLGLTALLGVAIVRGEARPAPGDPGPGWLQPRWRAGLPFVWVLGSLIVVPVVVYVATYIPWALSTAGGPQLFAGWPSGHTGQTFLDLQAQMYRYHDEFRFPHGAGSPWWAWPLDLKPLWGYLETFADGTQATVLGAANPFLLWMSVPAIGVGAWQAWRRRSWALGLVVIAFLGLWLPWARIDRVAFDYHYYVALPFAFLLLAWFLAELLDRPTERLVWFARRAFGVVLFLPTVLWVFKGPLCAVAGVDRVDPGAAACVTPITTVAAPLVAWTLFATGVFVFGVMGQRPRRMVGVMLGLAAVTSLALYPALSAVRLPNNLPWVYQGLLPSWDSSFQFWSNSAEAVSHPLLGIGSLAVLLAATALTAGAMWFARGWGRGTAGANGRPDLRFLRRSRAASEARPISPTLAFARPTSPLAGRRRPPADAAADATGTVALPRLSPRGVGAWAWRPRTVALVRPSTDLGLRGTVLVLLAISLVAALVVDRFGGFSGPWLWNFDMSLANYPFASYFHEALLKGTLPFWNDRVGMGFPLYAEGQIGALYPPNWLIYQLPPLVALDVARIVHLVLAGVGGGLIVLRMTGSRTGAATTAIVVVLCGGIASKLEWTQVVTVFGWMPWVLLPLLWRRPRPTRGFVVLAGVFWGIQALGGHPPYWVLTGIAAVVILLAQSPNRRGLGRVILFGLVGVGIGAVQLIPTLLITTLSWRAQGVGAGALFEYSATPFDFLAVAFGNAFVPAQGSGWDLFQSWYPGGSVWATLEVYAYVGLPALALAACGLVVRRARPVLIVAIVMVAIPLIGVVQPAIWAAIPGLNGLRHPIRAYLLLDLALAIGAGIGVARLGLHRSLRPAAVVTGIAVGGYLLIAIVAVAMPDVFGGLVRLFWPYVPVGQEGTIRDLAVAALTRLWPIVLELLLAGAVLLLLSRRGRAPAVRLAAVAVVALPLLLLTPAINQTQPSSAFTLEGTALANTVRGLQPRQVLTLDEPFYSGLPVVLADVGARDPHVYTSQFGLSLRLQSSEDLITNLRVAGPTSPLAMAIGVDTVVAFNGSCGGHQVATDPGFRATICRNDGALRPPYWLAASAVLGTRSGGVLPIAAVDAIVDPARAIKGSAAAAVSSWDDGSAVVNVDAPADGYVFLDRSWWPGWQVTVDGTSVTPERVWGGQLVAVSAGAHTIQQHLVPWDAALGFLITLASLTAIGVWAWRRRRTLAVIAGGTPRRDSRLPAVRVSTRSTLRRIQTVAIGKRVRGLNLKWTIIGLVSATGLAAIVADRFAGFGGPWLWNYDMAPGNYPLASFFHESLISGRLPLWDDRLGIGFPRYAEGQIGSFYPPNWLIYLLPPLQALDASRILHLTLAGAGAGAIVLRLSGSRLGALSAALVAVLCGGIASKLEWTQTVVVFGWMPWVILPLIWLRPRPTRGLVAIAGILWGVQALGGHPPYWALTGLAAAAIILATAPSLRGVARVVGFGAIGVAVGAIQLAPTVLLTAFSGRGQGLPPADLFQFSATPFDFLGVAFANALVPTGSPSWDLLKSWYPGGTWAILEAYAYVGLPALALAAIGLRTRRARPVLVVGVVAIIIPVIGVLQPSIWAQLPFASGLRHPVRAYLVLDLVLAIGAGLGVARLGRVWRTKAPFIVVTLAIVGYGLVAGMVVLVPSMFDALSSGFSDPATPRSLALDALARPWPVAFELILAGLTIWMIKRRLARPAARAVVVALVALPLALLVPSMNQALGLDSFSLDDASIVQAVRVQAPHRVVSIAVPFYGGFPDQLEGGFPDIYVQASLPLKSPTDLLGTIWADPASPLAPAVGIDMEVIFGRTCITGREVAYDKGWNAHMCRLDNATKPPYWLPADVVRAPPDTESFLIKAVDASIAPEQAIAAAVPARVRAWDTGHAVIEVQSSKPGYLFIDRGWWPAWQVSVDGTPVTPLRAFGGQLVPLSTGHHIVEEHLFLWEVLLGAIVSGATLMLLATLFVVSRRRQTPAGISSSTALDAT